MVLITIVNGVYKPTYNWGAPPCRDVWIMWSPGYGKLYGSRLGSWSCTLSAMLGRRFSAVPGLVNVYILLWKDPPSLMGKSTISTGPFSMAKCKRSPEGKFNCNSKLLMIGGVTTCQECESWVHSQYGMGGNKPTSKNPTSHYPEVENSQ